jgi:hypothetical protein
VLGLRVRIPMGAWMSLSGFVCCKVEISASGRAVVQRNRIQCVVPVCDHEASIVRRPWPTVGCCVMGPILYAIGRYETP